jgi:hypothetical protein
MSDDDDEDEDSEEMSLEALMKANLQKRKPSQDSANNNKNLQPPQKRPNNGGAPQ